MAKPPVGATSKKLPVGSGKALLDEKGLSFKHAGDNEFNLYGKDPENPVGWLHASPAGRGKLYSDDTFLMDEWQRQGIGQAMYDEVERITKKKLVPSEYLSDDSAKLWARRDPAALEEMIDKGMFDERVLPKVQDALRKYKAMLAMAGSGGMVAGLSLGSSESEASVASLYDRGMKIRRQLHTDPTRQVYRVTDRATGEEIAGADFYEQGPGVLQGFSMGVNEPYRGQGIATEMYDAVEELSGRQLQPSNFLTDDGLAFWMKRDPDAVQAMYERQGGRDRFPEGHKYTQALKSRLGSLIPAGTIGALGALSSNDTAAADIGAGVLDVANRGGEMLVNDLLQGSQSLSNALYDTRDAATQVRFAPRTEAGDALSEGILSDLGNYLNYSGIVDGMPSTSDLIQGGIGLYNEYVKPHLSDRMEMGLGGALLAGSTLIPGSKTAKAGDWVTDTRTVVRNTEGESGDLIKRVLIKP